MLGITSFGSFGGVGILLLLLLDMGIGGVILGFESFVFILGGEGFSNIH